MDDPSMGSSYASLFWRLPRLVDEFDEFERNCFAVVGLSAPVAPQGLRNETAFDWHEYGTGSMWDNGPDLMEVEGEEFADPAEDAQEKFSLGGGEAGQEEVGDADGPEDDIKVRSCDAFG